MAVAKGIEITAASTDSFDDAIRRDTAKASETVRNIRAPGSRSRKSRSQTTGTSAEYRLDLKVSFVLTIASEGSSAK